MSHCLRRQVEENLSRPYLRIRQPMMEVVGKRGVIACHRIQRVAGVVGGIRERDYHQTVVPQKEKCLPLAGHGEVSLNVS